jgi:7,8-dihydroneopterin aldolase/epimerase/oxygenase
MTEECGDQIHIEQLELQARVGVTEVEREKPQRLTINMTLWLRVSADDLNDDVTKTVNYSSLCAETKQLVEGRSDKLIETLAENVAAHLLKKFPIRMIKIELRKFVLTDAAYVSVIITRAAAIH